MFTSRSSSEKSTYQCTFRTYLIFSSTYRRTYWMFVKTTFGYFEPLESLAKATDVFPSHYIAKVDMMSLAWHWIFCQCWSRWRSDSFQEAGRKTRSQIRLIQLKQFQRVSSPQRSGPGTHMALALIGAGMRSVCTILFLEMVLITCF